MTTHHDPNSFPYVNLPQLDLRISPTPNEENSLGKHHNMASDGSLATMAAKRRKFLTQSPPASETNNTPRSSRLSSPSTIATSLESEEEMGDMVETQGYAYLYTKPMDTERRTHREALDNPPSRYRAKVGEKISVATIPMANFFSNHISRHRHLPFRNAHLELPAPLMEGLLHRTRIALRLVPTLKMSWMGRTNFSAAMKAAVQVLPLEALQDHSLNSRTVSTLFLVSLFTLSQICRFAYTPACRSTDSRAGSRSFADAEHLEELLFTAR